MTESEPTYEITWTTTIVETHTYTASLAELATMLGTTEAEVLAASPDELAQLGGRGLPDGLADVEDTDTVIEEVDLQREDIRVVPVGPR